MLFVKILILWGLIKILMETDQPFICSAAYTIIVGGLGFFLYPTIQYALIAIPIIFVASSLYFWLLSKLEGSPLWWVVAILGIVIGLV